MAASRLLGQLGFQRPSRRTEAKVALNIPALSKSLFVRRLTPPSNSPMLSLILLFVLYWSQWPRQLQITASPRLCFNKQQECVTIQVKIWEVEVTHKDKADLRIIRDIGTVRYIIRWPHWFTTCCGYEQVVGLHDLWRTLPT